MMDTSGHAARPSAVSAIAHNQSVALRFDVSRELLERDELLQRIAGRIKKIIRYHLFDVMVWNAAAETK